MNREKKIKYNVVTFRLSKWTKRMLAEEKVKSGMTWNRFLYQLINEYKKNEK